MSKAYDWHQHPHPHTLSLSHTKPLLLAVILIGRQQSRYIYWLVKPRVSLDSNGSQTALKAPSQGRTGTRQVISAGEGAKPWANTPWQARQVSCESLRPWVGERGAWPFRWLGKSKVSCHLCSVTDGIKLAYRDVGGKCFRTGLSF